MKTMFLEKRPKSIAMKDDSRDASSIESVRHVGPVTIVPMTDPVSNRIHHKYVHFATSQWQGVDSQVLSATRLASRSPSLITSW
jgi:hypothetical protein